jgi:hypothetical protein
LLRRFVLALETTSDKARRDQIWLTAGIGARKVRGQAARRSQATEMDRSFLFNDPTTSRVFIDKSLFFR